MIDEFKEIDLQINTFVADFEKAILLLITKEHPNIQKDDELFNIIYEYALDMFNLSDSVIHKDFSYPDYRKNDELKSMDTLLNSMTKDYPETTFNQMIHKKAKSFTVKYFSDIMNLSSTGYLIMERYNKMSNIMFLGKLKRFIQ